MPSKQNAHDSQPSQMLQNLAVQALDLTKRAKRNRQNLGGDNFYGNKLAVLRSDATNAFRALSSQSVGDTTALAELIEPVFSAHTAADVRLQASRDLLHALKTTWKEAGASSPDAKAVDFFPPAIIEKTNRTSIVVIGRQMNGCFGRGWYDACAVMMRRLLETSIIEAYEKKGVADTIKGKDGNYFQLSKLIDCALNETKLPLSRNAKQMLPGLRDVGHLSAHSRYFHATKPDLEKVQHGCRVVLEEFFHHAGLI
jgi:hypothetical protein